MLSENLGSYIPDSDKYEAIEESGLRATGRHPRGWLGFERG
jgi:hypothetical protein